MEFLKTVGDTLSAPRRYLWSALGLPEYGNELVADLTGMDPSSFGSHALGFGAEVLGDPLTYAGAALGAAGKLGRVGRTLHGAEMEKYLNDAKFFRSSIPEIESQIASRQQMIDGNAPLVLRNMTNELAGVPNIRPHDYYGIARGDTFTVPMSDFGDLTTIAARNPQTRAFAYMPESISNVLESATNSGAISGITMRNGQFIPAQRMYPGIDIGGERFLERPRSFYNVGQNPHAGIMVRGLSDAEQAELGLNPFIPLNNVESMTFMGRPGRLPAGVDSHLLQNGKISQKRLHDMIQYSRANVGDGMSPASLLPYEPEFLQSRFADGRYTGRVPQMHNQMARDLAVERLNQSMDLARPSRYHAFDPGGADPESGLMLLNSGFVPDSLNAGRSAFQQAWNNLAHINSPLDPNANIRNLLRQSRDMEGITQGIADYLAGTVANYDRGGGALLGALASLGLPRFGTNRD